MQMFGSLFKSKFLSKASNWLLEQELPVKCSVYKPVCEFPYELLNFTMKGLCEKFAEIDFNFDFDLFTFQS